MSLKLPTQTYIGSCSGCRWETSQSGDAATASRKIFEDHDEASPDCDGSIEIHLTQTYGVEEIDAIPTSMEA